MLATGHRVIYKQLLAWLLHGHLYDPWGKLLIVREEEGESEERDECLGGRARVSSVGATAGGELSGLVCHLLSSLHVSARYRLDQSQMPVHYT